MWADRQPASSWLCLETAGRWEHCTGPFPCRLMGCQQLHWAARGACRPPGSRQLLMRSCTGLLGGWQVPLQQAAAQIFSQHRAAKSAAGWGCIGLAGGLQAPWQQTTVEQLNVLDPLGSRQLPRATLNTGLPKVQQAGDALGWQGACRHPGSKQLLQSFVSN